MEKKKHSSLGWLCLVFFTAAVLSCPGDTGNPAAAEVFSPPVLTFEVDAEWGTEFNGMIQYRFTAVSNAQNIAVDGFSYTVYIAPGPLFTALSVINAAGEPGITGLAPDTPYLFEGTPGTLYSAVVYAKRGDVVLTSPVIREQALLYIEGTGPVTAPVLSFTGDGVNSGDDGNIQYSFTAAEIQSGPVSGAAYIVYICQGQWDTAAQVRQRHIAQNNAAPGVTAIFSGTAGIWYSAVVYTWIGGIEVASEVQQAQGFSSTEFDVRFGVIADTHMGYSGRGAGSGSLNYSLHDRLAKVVRWYADQPGVSHLAIVGDITDNGNTGEWTTFSNTWNANKGDLQLIAQMGNHDAYPTDKTTAAERFTTGTGQRELAHYVINGYHFIVITAGSGAVTEDATPVGGAIASARAATPGASGNHADVGATVLTWLRGRINAAKADAPGMPIFVFHHWPVRNTFYVSNLWYTSSFGTSLSDFWFRNDPEVIIFGGHIHTPNNDPRSIWQGGFTSVNAPSTNYIEMETGYLGDGTDGITNRTYPKIAAQAYGQGIVVSAKGSRVTIENWDFDLSEGPRDSSSIVRIPQTWEFDVSKPAEFPYTTARRELQKTAPVFNAGAAITFKNIANTTVEVEFTQAVMPQANPGGEVVHSYQFDFIDKLTGEVMVTRRQWSDFMLTPRLQKPAYTQILGGLSPGTEYELRIYAFGSFQERSTQYLSADFTTTGTPVPPLEFDLKFQNNLSNTRPNPSAVTVTGTAQYEDGRKTGQRAIRLNGDNYIQLDTAGEPFNYERSLTIAFWVKVLSTKGSDPVLFSNKNWAAGGNNGFLFKVTSNSIRLNSTSVNGTRLGSGANDLTIASNVTDNWVHITVVYDRSVGTGQVRYYANGQMVGQDSSSNTDLVAGISGGQRSYIGQSMATGSYAPLYNGTNQSYDVTFLMQDFLLINSALSDTEVAALAAE